MNDFYEDKYGKEVIREARRILNYRGKPENEIKIGQEEDAVKTLEKSGVDPGEAYKVVGDLILENAETKPGNWLFSNPRKVAIELYEKAAEEGYDEAGVQLERMGVRVKERSYDESVSVGKEKGTLAEKLLGREKYPLHQIIFAVMSGGGLFLLSSNLTGNVVLNMSHASSNILGTVLFAAGITGLFFSLRKLKRKKE